MGSNMIELSDLEKDLIIGASTFLNCFIAGAIPVVTSSGITSDELRSRVHNIAETVSFANPDLETYINLPSKRRAIGRRTRRTLQRFVEKTDDTLYRASLEGIVYLKVWAARALDAYYQIGHDMSLFTLEKKANVSEFW